MAGVGKAIGLDFAIFVHRQDDGLDIHQVAELPDGIQDGRCVQRAM